MKGIRRNRTNLTLDKVIILHYNNLVYRGMAKFGIALGSGPRGLGFESRYSDHYSGDHFRGRRFFLLTFESSEA